MKIFYQTDQYNRIIDKFKLSQLFGKIREEANQLDIDESIQFTGTTILTRIS